jgi:hypothetical protein
VFVLAVRLEMLPGDDCLFDEVLEILGSIWGEAFIAKETKDGSV